MNRDDGKCAVPDCNKFRVCKTFCNQHYKRWRKTGNPTTPLYAEMSVADRFWSHVVKTDTCWLYGSKPSPHTYGCFNLNGKPRRASRVAYYLHYGEWPEPLCLHSCDNKSCVNPEHLSAGTYKQNSIERFDRCPGNIACGERQGAVKLTDEQVIAIRKEWTPHQRGDWRTSNGKSIAGLARKYGVARQAISVIVKEKGWKHLIEQK